jgi:hypothetical protein
VPGLASGSHRGRRGRRHIATRRRPCCGHAPSSPGPSRPARSPWEACPRPPAVARRSNPARPSQASARPSPPRRAVWFRCRCVRRSTSPASASRRGAATGRRPRSCPSRPTGRRWRERAWCWCARR